jgi:hypothetical protein
MILLNFKSICRGVILNTEINDEHLSLYKSTKAIYRKKTFE